MTAGFGVSPSSSLCPTCYAHFNCFLSRFFLSCLSFISVYLLLFAFLPLLLQHSNSLQSSCSHRQIFTTHAILTLSAKCLCARKREREQGRERDTEELRGCCWKSVLASCFISKSGVALVLTMGSSCMCDSFCFTWVCEKCLFLLFLHCFVCI